jgi:hypothetical protein
VARVYVLDCHELELAHPLKDLGPDCVAQMSSVLRIDASLERVSQLMQLRTEVRQRAQLHLRTC